MKKEKMLYWRKLDNSAKIFPISAGKKYSTVFRFSCVLKEKIQPLYVLQVFLCFLFLLGSVLIACVFLEFLCFVQVISFVGM